MKKLQISGIVMMLSFSALSVFAQTQIYNGPGGVVLPNAALSNRSVGIGTNNPTGAALHILTGSGRRMLPPAIKLDRNDGTNQAGLLTVGISGNGFAAGLGGGSAFFKLEDPYGNSANSDMGFSTNGAAAQLVIKHNGTIGIGTSNPSGAAMHLLTGSNPGMLPPAVKLDRNDGTNQAGLLTIGISGNGFATGLGGGSAFFKLEDPYGNSANSDMGFSTNGAAAQLVIKHNGNVGIGTSAPTEKLHVAGNICYTGSIAACSDARYKTNIVSLDNPMEKILLLNGVTYNWNIAAFPGMNFSDKKQIGFIAQDVEKLFPELVFTDANGYKSIDYTRLTPLLVETVKDQQKEIIDIRKRLDEIERKLIR
jgi:Chaperone of endosialidase